MVHQLQARAPDDTHHPYPGSFCARRAGRPGPGRPPCRAGSGASARAGRSLARAVAGALPATAPARSRRRHRHRPATGARLAGQPAPAGLDSAAQQRLGHAELAFCAQEHAPNDPVVWLELAQVRLRAGQLPPAWPAWTPCRRWGRCRHRRSCCKRACWWKAVTANPPTTPGPGAVPPPLAQPSLQGEVAATGAFARAGVTPRGRCAPCCHTRYGGSVASRPNTAVTQHGHAYLARLAHQPGRSFPGTTLAGPGLPVCRQPVGPGQPGASGADGPPRLAGAETAQRPVHRLGHTPGPRQPGSRLRLVYVASQSHSRLLQRVLASHDPAQVEVFVYSQQPLGDLPACTSSHWSRPNWQRLRRQSDRRPGCRPEPFEGQYALLERYGRQCKWPGWAAGQRRQAV